MSVPLLCGFEGLRFNCMVARLNDALTFYSHNHAVKPIILKKLQVILERFRDYYYLFARRLGDQFRGHLCADIERNEKDARHFNLPHHSKHHMAV